MYWEHHPLSFVSGPSYTRKQSYISACRSPAGFIRGARGRAGGYAEVVSPSLSLSLLSFSLRWLKLEERKGEGSRIGPAANIAEKRKETGGGIGEQEWRCALSA